MRAYTAAQSRRTLDWDRLLLERRRRRRCSFLVGITALAVLLALSYLFFWGRRYLLLSVLVLLVVMGMFLYNVERQRLRARELVLLSVVTAACVAMNEVCAHTVPLHAGTAMVVISGIALGPESGFLVGALSRFLCNFFDGQGPWTPWQMVAWGMIGGLAGVVFNQTKLRHKAGKEDALAQRLSLAKNRSFVLIMPPVLCVLATWLVAWLVSLWQGEGTQGFAGWRLYAFGVAGLAAGCLLQRKRLSADVWSTTIYTFLTVFLLYGGIMNFAAMLLSASADPVLNKVDFETLRLLYATGVPYDLAHAGTAAFCVFLFGDSMLQRLERIQIKFGIVL